MQQDEYIETTIASIEKKSGDKYDLSIPFLGNAIQIQNPEVNRLQQSSLLKQMY
jgi:hypothetical protein